MDNEARVIAIYLCDFAQDLYTFEKSQYLPNKKDINKYLSDKADIYYRQLKEMILKELEDDNNV